MKHTTAEQSLNKNNPEGLTSYEEFLRDKYLRSDRYDEGDGAEFDVDSKGKELVLDERMRSAREEYLAASAKRQKGHWLGMRYTKSGAWLQARFPRVADVVLGALSKREDNLEEFGVKYEEAMADVLNRDHKDEASRREFLVNQLTKDAHTIAAMQREGSGRPMNKWLRRAGYAGAGFVAGSAAVVLGPIGSVVVAGGALVTAAGLRMKANKMNAKLTAIDDDGNEVYVADQKAKEHAENFRNNFDPTKAADVVDYLTVATSHEVRDNRRRIIAPMLGTLAAYMASRGIVTGLNYLMNSADTANSGTDVASNFAGTGDTGSAAGSADQRSLNDIASESTFAGRQFDTVEESVDAVSQTPFTVEYGHGYTHELIDLVQASGRELSPEDAFKLHQHLMEVFGDSYINIEGGGIYRESGDVRLTTPGSAQWHQGVAEEVQSWMSQRGLW